LIIRLPFVNFWRIKNEGLFGVFFVALGGFFYCGFSLRYKGRKVSGANENDRRQAQHNKKIGRKQTNCGVCFAYYRICGKIFYLTELRLMPRIIFGVFLLIKF
jgi:hypothetical protein